MLPVAGALALACQLPAQIGNDSWLPNPIELRMDNPYFPTNSNPDDDYFAPVHGILGPHGDIMLIGFRQSLLQIDRTAQQTADLRTGSMGAILTKADLTLQSGSATLTDLPEYRQVSCGVRTNSTTMYPAGPGPAEFVESDPTDGQKELFVDRLFCAGHTPLEDGSILTVGGLRVTRRWFDGNVMANASFGGGTPLLERWSWNIDNASWVPLDTPLQGIGDLTAAPTGSPNSTNWWPSCLQPAPSGGIFTGNERYYGTATLMLDGQVLVSGGTWFLNLEGATSIATGFLPGNNSNNVSVELYDPFDDTGHGTSTVLSADPGSGVSAPATSPQEIFNPDFTHVFVLPSPVTPSDAHPGHGYDLLVLGSPGIPFGFDLDMPDWYRQEATVPPVAGWPQRPNAPTTPASYALMANDGSTSVLLPLRMSVNGSGVNDWGYHNGAVMYAGGFKNSGKPEPDISDQIDVTVQVSALGEPRCVHEEEQRSVLPRALVAGSRGAFGEWRRAFRRDIV